MLTWAWRGSSSGPFYLPFERTFTISTLPSLHRAIGNRPNFSTCFFPHPGSHARGTELAASGAFRSGRPQRRVRRLVPLLGEHPPAHRLTGFGVEEKNRDRLQIIRCCGRLPSSRWHYTRRCGTRTGCCRTLVITLILSPRGSVRSNSDLYAPTTAA